MKGVLLIILLLQLERFQTMYKKILLNNRNIEVVTYDNADGSHKELLDSLKQLIELVEERRGTISENYSW